jgi:PmbA protein
MIKEQIHQLKESTILHIQKTRIHSIQKKSIKKTGMRVYHAGHIGVAGAVGEYIEADLERKALEMLKMDVPYQPEPTMDKKHNLFFNRPVFDGADFIADMENLLSKLESRFPEFAFSHTINLNDYNYTMNNDAGLSLHWIDHFMDLQFLFKHEKSVELIDGHLSCTGRHYDLETFLEYCQEKLNAYLHPIELAQEKQYPIIFSSDFLTLFIKFMQDLNGRNMATKGSKLHDKIGTKLFNENFTLYQSRNSENLMIPFYDAEGTFHPDSDYKLPLIQEGRFLHGFTDKRTAMEYGLFHTGSASSDFDGIPTLNSPYFEVQSGTKNLSEILEGRDAIYVDMASGGDYTPNGEFATPVQSAYLVKGGHLIGKLGGLQINSRLEDMFGKDFVGVGSEPLFPLNSEKPIVINFNVKKM